MKLLFICSGNKLRSPTAEKVFSDNYNTRSAGTSRNANHEVNIDDIKWADKIFVMEEKHKQRMLSYFPRPLQFKNIEVLNIPDDFTYMQEELINILNSKIDL